MPKQQLYYSLLGYEICTVSWYSPDESATIDPRQSQPA